MRLTHSGSARPPQSVSSCCFRETQGLGIRDPRQAEHPSERVHQGRAREGREDDTDAQDVQDPTATASDAPRCTTARIAEPPCASGDAYWSRTRGRHGRSHGPPTYPGIKLWTSLATSAANLLLRDRSAPKMGGAVRPLLEFHPTPQPPVVVPTVGRRNPLTTT